MARNMCHMSEWTLAYRVLHMVSTLQRSDHKAAKQRGH